MRAWRPFRVIGLGNAYRCDDGVGLCVARSLRRRLPWADVIETSGEATALVDLWADAERVMVIDATVSDAPAGTVRRLDLLAMDPIPVGFRSSSHTFGLAHAVALGRALRRLPCSLVAYGIEARDLSYGQSLSKPVVNASDQVCDLLCAEILADRNPDNDRPTGQA